MQLTFFLGGPYHRTTRPRPPTKVIPASLIGPCKAQPIRHDPEWLGHADAALSLYLLRSVLFYGSQDVADVYVEEDYVPTRDDLRWIASHHGRPARSISCPVSKNARVG